VRRDLAAVPRGRSRPRSAPVHLPDGRHTADLVRDALVEAFTQLPAVVRRSLTWDQGKEMALHARCRRRELIAPNSVRTT
jgi:IS30 family transposase